jgi:hypothetical protein
MILGIDATQLHDTVRLEIRKSLKQYRADHGEDSGIGGIPRAG